jgi:hypothetical protein
MNNQPYSFEWVLPEREDFVDHGFLALAVCQGYGSHGQTNVFVELDTIDTPAEIVAVLRRHPGTVCEPFAIARKRRITADKV